MEPNWLLIIVYVMLGVYSDFSGYIYGYIFMDISKIHLYLDTPKCFKDISKIYGYMRSAYIHNVYKQSGYISNGYISLNGYIKIMQKVHGLLPCKPGHQSNNIYWESVFVCPPSLSPPHRVNELRGVTPTTLAPLRHMWLRWTLSTNVLV